MKSRGTETAGFRYEESALKGEGGDDSSFAEWLPRSSSPVTGKGAYVATLGAVRERRASAA